MLIENRLPRHWAERAIKTKRFFICPFSKTFLRDESGAAAAEYALILAIVGAGIAVAAGALGTAVSAAINSATTTI